MFYSIEQVKQANRNAGNHFFDADTMRFFRSRVSDYLYPLNDGGAIIVTSERFVSYHPSYHAEPRRYSIRRVDAEGVIMLHRKGVWEFQLFASRNGAHAAAKREADKLNQWATREV